MKVQQEGDDKKARFFIEEDGQRIGTIEYVYAGTDKLIIEHTEVDTSYEGKGIGKALVAAVVDFARAKGIKVIPLCPYAKARFERVPEYADVWFGK